MSGSLVKKLTEVMAAVERIPKRGRNEFHKYDYATEADIAATVRAELASRQVMLIPAIVGESRHSVGEKGSVLTVLEMEMEFLDGESGESIKKPWRGYGTDKEDKGGYKAMTGGEKYFLLKTFLMPTGDDPEADDPKSRQQPRTAQRIAKAEDQRYQESPAHREVVQRAEQRKAQAATITDAQRNELRDLATKAQWPSPVVQAMLKRHGFDNSRDITVGKFGAIKAELAAGLEQAAK